MDVREARHRREQAALIEGYESLLDRAKRMLDFARAGSWPALIDEEARYMVEVERLHRLEAGFALDAETRARCTGLLEGVFEHSLEIKRHLAGRRDVLQRGLEASRCRPRSGFSDPAPRGGREAVDEETR